ncbi:peptide-methionine (S)-S-oxide reductase MsrA [Mycoplasma sp. P36-A1]|uniref:peptide-methionine (S)-S-oxide reductase MsrA n=1 Tax=Mycoplasma sp. P36-A1 TaxID=3252900 RepID=UPI003C30E3B9
MKRIVVAGGCFWGVEEYFRRLKGVEKTSVGYVNGTKYKLTYEEVCSGVFQAKEGVEIFYDENIIDLNKILEHLFRIIDPTSLDKQGNDVGVSYRTGVYYTDINDKTIIDNFIMNEQAKYNKPIVVEVELENGFFHAEDYHQAYLVKNPSGYCHVNFSKINENELK